MNVCGSRGCHQKSVTKSRSEALIPPPNRVGKHSSSVSPRDRIYPVQYSTVLYSTGPSLTPVSASRVLSSSGALAAPPAVTHLPRAPSFRRPPSSRRGDRRSGSGWRQGRVRRGRPLLSRPRGAVDSGLFLRLLSRSRFSCGCVVGFEWMVVRFVRVIRVPACARVSRVSRVSVCVPAPPGVFFGYGIVHDSTWNFRDIPGTCTQPEKLSTCMST